MKKLLLLLCAVLTSLWARADLGGFSLRHASVDVVAHENGVWDVTETLRVEFHEPRHGIYRDIPTSFDYAFNLSDGSSKEYSYRTIIKDVDVSGYDFTTDGEEDFSEESASIKIGSPDRTVEGLQTYVINYKLQYQADRFDGEDFLCHTIWGTKWDAEVDTLTFKIKFDKPLPENFSQKLHVYSGAHGDTRNADSVVCRVGANTILGCGYALPANHGVTISARLPEGYWQVESKDGTLFNIFSTLAGVAVCVLLWLILKRRSKIVPTVAFYPPDGISSAEVGKIIDNSTDPIDLASLIPWLAHKGYITIKGRRGMGGSIVLKKVKDLPGDAPDYQRKFMDEVFGKKSKIKVRDLEYCYFDNVKKSLDKSFKGDRELFAPAKWLYWYLLLLFAFAGMLVTGHVVEPVDWTLLGTGGFIFFIFSLYLFVRQYASGQSRYFKRRILNFGCLNFICVFFLIVDLYMTWESGDILYAPTLMFILKVFILIISFLAGRLSIDSDYRARVLSELLGLRQFIQIAEKDRLQQLSGKDPQYFYDILPYAMVFGLETQWAKSFSTIGVESTGWLEGSDSDISNLESVILATTAVSEISDYIHTACSPSDSDSSDSGGGSSYSGGGGGGGGGGSW